MADKFEKYQRPDKFEQYAKKEEPQGSNGPGKLESALRGASQAATFGFGDEAQAFLRSLSPVQIGSTAGGWPKLEGNTEFGEYSKLRDQQRAANVAAQEENPWSYGGGAVAASLPQGLLTGRAALTVAKTLPGRLGVAGATGGALGAVHGVGKSEDDLARSVRNEALIGVAGGVLGQGVGEALYAAPAVAKAIAGKIPGTKTARANAAAKEAADAAEQDAQDILVETMKRPPMKSGQPTPSGEGAPPYLEPTLTPPPMPRQGAYEVLKAQKTAAEAAAKATADEQAAKAAANPDVLKGLLNSSMLPGVVGVGNIARSRYQDENVPDYLTDPYSAAIHDATQGATGYFGTLAAQKGIPFLGGVATGAVQGAKEGIKNIPNTRVGSWVKEEVTAPWRGREELRGTGPLLDYLKKGSSEPILDPRASLGGSFAPKPSESAPPIGAEAQTASRKAAMQAQTSAEGRAATNADSPLAESAGQGTRVNTMPSTGKAIDKDAMQLADELRKGLISRTEYDEGINTLQNRMTSDWMKETGHPRASSNEGTSSVPSDFAKREMAEQTQQLGKYKELIDEGMSPNYVTKALRTERIDPEDLAAELWKGNEKNLWHNLPGSADPRYLKALDQLSKGQITREEFGKAAEDLSRARIKEAAEAMRSGSTIAQKQINENTNVLNDWLKKQQ